MVRIASAAPYGDIVKEITEYNGLKLLQSETNSGFYKDVLDSILDLFNYVDALKEFSPVFMRFDFPAKSTEENVIRFFDRAKKLHQRKSWKFFYMYTREFEPIHKHSHYHAFCIVDRRRYTSALNIEKMLQAIWDYEIERNPILKDCLEDKDKNLWFSRIDRRERYKPPHERSNRRYNFYSLSSDSRAIPGDRDRAFEAASYMAKITQVPSHDLETPRKRRRGRSILPKLAPDDIRPGYDSEKAKHLLKAPPPLKNERIVV